MALREDYYTPCLDEINRKINLIDDLIGEVNANKTRDLIGFENSKYVDKIEEEVQQIVNDLNEMKEILETEKSNLMDA